MRECRSAGAAGSPQALAEEVPGVARHNSFLPSESPVRHCVSRRCG